LPDALSASVIHHVADDRDAREPILHASEGCTHPPGIAKCLPNRQRINALLSKGANLRRGDAAREGGQCATGTVAAVGACQAGQRTRQGSRCPVAVVTRSCTCSRAVGAVCGQCTG